MNKITISIVVLSYALVTACASQDRSPPGTNKVAAPVIAPTGQDATTKPAVVTGDQRSNATPPAEPKTTPTPAPAPRVLGLFGGYLSCSGDAAAPFKNSTMLRYLEQIQGELVASGASKAKYIISCFAVDVTRVKFSSSDKPDEVREVLLADFYSAVEAMIAATPGSPVHIIGHSYGGWLSMDFVKKAKAGLSLASLTTIDPISRVRCTPALVISSIFGDPANPACLSAPADFSKTDLDAITQRTQTWLNFYQTDASLLHSGPMTGAENVKRKYASGSLESHGEIAQDPDVMKQVIAVMKK